MPVAGRAAKFQLRSGWQPQWESATHWGPPRPAEMKLFGGFAEHPGTPQGQASQCSLIRLRGRPKEDDFSYDRRSQKSQIEFRGYAAPQCGQATPYRSISHLMFCGYAAVLTPASESYQYQPITAHHPAASYSKSWHSRIDNLQPAQLVPILQDFDVCSAHVA